MTAMRSHKSTQNAGQGSADSAAGESEYERIIIISLADKGGVGKSEFSKALVDWISAQKGVTWIANDPDSENKTLSKAFPERARPHTPLSPDFTPGGVNFIDIKRTSDLDNCFKCLEKNDVSIVDGVGAAQSVVFGQWLEEADLLTIAKDWGIGITFVLIQDDSTEPINQAALAFDKWGDAVRWIVVFNQNQRPLEHFIQWPGSPAERKFRELQSAGRATSYILEKVPEQSVDFMRKHSMSVGGMAAAGEKLLHVMDHGRFKRMLVKRNERFEAVRDFLLPTKFLQ